VSALVKTLESAELDGGKVEEAVLMQKMAGNVPRVTKSDGKGVCQGHFSLARDSYSDTVFGRCSK
jgi:hypothetical protein